MTDALSGPNAGAARHNSPLFLHDHGGPSFSPLTALRNLRRRFLGLVSRNASIRDALWILLATFVVYLIADQINETFILFRYVADHPQYDLDDILLAIFVVGCGLLVFSVNRWRDLKHEMAARSAAEAKEKLAGAVLQHAERVRMVGEMTVGIVHDLRNTLTVADLNLEAALDVADLPEPARDYLLTVQAKLHSANAMQTRMLTFARARQPSTESIDLNRWLESMRDIMKVMLDARFTVELVTDPSLRRCHIDRQQLESVVLNLILNARDAMASGGTIVVRTELLMMWPGDDTTLPPLPMGSYAVLTVADSGVGMPPAVAAKAFDWFYTTKPEGTGLGLGMVRQTVEQACGAVTLTSAPGKGTSVRVLLPGG